MAENASHVGYIEMSDRIRRLHAAGTEIVVKGLPHIACCQIDRGEMIKNRHIFWVELLGGQPFPKSTFPVIHFPKKISVRIANGNITRIRFRKAGISGSKLFPVARC